MRFENRDQTSYGVITLDEQFSVTGIRYVDTDDYWTACCEALERFPEVPEFELVDNETVKMMREILSRNGPETGSRQQRIKSIKDEFSTGFSHLQEIEKRTGYKEALHLLEAVVNGANFRI